MGVSIKCVDIPSQMDATLRAPKDGKLDNPLDARNLQKRRGMAREFSGNRKVIVGFIREKLK